MGTPKSGTTWLFHYLQKYPQVNLGHKKEYHVFDTFFLPEYDFFKASIPENLPQHSFQKKYLDEKNIHKKLQEDHIFYGEFFANILKHPKTLITGDFTPNYCALDDNQFKYIFDITAQHNLNTHVIYFVRDPVERIISYARMAYKFRMHEGKKINPNADFNEFTEKIFLSNSSKSVSNYQKTITTLSKCFAESRLHFGIYETMHTTAEINRLSQFLDIKPDYSIADQRINSTSQVKLNISEKLRSDIREYYRIQFEFCREFFKMPNLASYWKNYQSS